MREIFYDCICGSFAGGARAFSISIRDFVAVAETPNFAKLEMIFFKSTFSFAIFSTSTFLYVVDVSCAVKVS